MNEGAPLYHVFVSPKRRIALDVLAQIRDVLCQHRASGRASMIVHDLQKQNPQFQLSQPAPNHDYITTRTRAPTTRKNGCQHAIGRSTSKLSTSSKCWLPPLAAHTQMSDLLSLRHALLGPLHHQEEDQDLQYSGSTSAGTLLLVLAALSFTAVVLRPCHSTGPHPKSCTKFLNVSSRARTWMHTFVVCERETKPTW